MLTDWTHWLSQKHPEALLALLCGLLLIDTPRYALGTIMMVVFDMAASALRWLRGHIEQETFDYCPNISVIIAGHNEADTIGATLESLWGTYPRMEVIVVDDGSADDMAGVARRFARNHPGVIVLSRSRRSGKPSALNFGMRYATGEVIVFVDADSHLGHLALWRIVQPLQRPEVGAVSATVHARNAFAGLVTWLQAYEYLQTIFVGRQLLARLGVLSIVSGGFGAYRREALQRFKGADVELAEDMDLTIRTRKAGYQIAFTPHAHCYTNVPATWRGLIRQRLRWEESSIIRLICRKHADIGYFWNPNRNWSNFLVFLDFIFFNVVLVGLLWAYMVWFFFVVPIIVWDKMLLTLCLAYVGLEFLRVFPALYYSADLRRDLLLCACFPLAPLYQLLLFFVRSRGLVEETFLRKSYGLNHIPAHVREATWRW
jgi:cellulose synthase/poly-beta-1,6-N-acetylglucosamine synthase-like glycosyltransferase